MVSYTKTEMAEGIVRARDLSKRFAEDAGSEMTTSATSALGTSVFSRVRPENIHAVVVYKRPAGWFCDVVMENLPAGVPNVIGTPVNMPLATRAEADDAAWGNFSMLMQQAVRNTQERPDPSAPDIRPFEMHGVVFDIPGEIVDMSIMAASLLTEHERGSLADAQEKMTRYLTEIMGSDRFDPAAWASADIGIKQKVLASMVMQLGFGTARYPSRQPDTGPGPFH